MKKFDKKALELIRTAVYKDKPFLMLTNEENELNVSYRGSEDILVQSLAMAMGNDSDLKRIIIRAQQLSRDNHLEPTLMKLKTA